VHVGVSYLLPAEVDRLLEAEQEKHEAVHEACSERQRQPFVDEKHKTFIDDLMYVTAAHWHTVCCTLAHSLMYTGRQFDVHWQTV